MRPRDPPGGPGSDYPSAHYLSGGGGNSASPSTSSPRASAAKSVFQSYFYGQLANVVKAAIWWSTFGVFAEALTQWQLAVGVTRLAFNASLIIVSPIAGAATETVPIQRLLRLTTTGRCAIWCLLIPAAWYLIAVHLQWRRVFSTAFLLIMLLDGLLVSFANVVDVDCGGLDTFAAQLGLTASAALKEKFTQIHQRVFDLSFVCLTPLIALAVWVLAATFDKRGLQGPPDSPAAVLAAVAPPLRYSALQHWEPRSLLVQAVGDTATTAAVAASSISVGPVATTAAAVTRECWGLSCKSENFDVAMLVAGVCVPVGLLSAVSLLCYRRSSKYARAFPVRPLELVLEPQQPQQRLVGVLQERLWEVWEGLRAVAAERPLCWRLTFLACETALEDAIVSILFPQVAIQAVPLLYNAWFQLPPAPASEPLGIPQLMVPGGWTMVNLFAVILIALGKLGGLMASCRSTTRWVQPASVDSVAYRRLMWSILLSGLCLILFPLALVFVAEPERLEPVVSILHLGAPRARAVTAVVLMLTGSLLYFVFVTAPKFGLANLLQAVAAQGNVDSQVFSFVGTYVTATDALVILLLSWNFSSHSGDHERFLRALLLTVGGYIIYGCIEVVLSPRLILRPVALRAELDEMSLSAEYPGISALSPGGAADFDFGALDARSNFRHSWNEHWSDPLRPMTGGSDGGGPAAAQQQQQQQIGSWA